MANPQCSKNWGPILEKIKRIFNRIEEITTRITAFLIIMLTILVSWEVFARYVLNTGAFWAEEVSITAMMWIAFLGASGGIWTDSHICLKFVIEIFPDTMRKTINIINYIIVGSFSLLLFNFGITLVKKTISGKLSATNIPIGYTYLIIPISTAFMVIFSLLKIVQAIIKFKQRDEIK